AIEVVQDIERAESPATGQRVRHEIHRPDHVRVFRHVQRHPIPLGQAAACLATQVEPHGLVHAVDPLVIPRATAAQAFPAFPEASVRALLNQLCQLRDDLGITHRPVQRRAVPGCHREPDAGTGPPHRPRVYLDEVPHGLPLLRRPYSFFAMRSFMAALSRASSAYMRFSLEFSASSSLTRRSSEASRPPYLAFHA